MIGLKRGIVRLTTYNSKWAQIFEKERKFLKRKLGNGIIDIQHIGSTSIPGMPAKPIIDISISIKSMKNSRDFIKLFEDLGYEYRPDFGGPNIQLLFVKGSESKRTHYIHLMKYQGSIWKNDLLFRDYLRKNKQKAQEYAVLKKDLAKKYSNDRVNYTTSKADFIQSVIKLAKKEL